MTAGSDDVIVCIPIFNDWTSARVLLDRLDRLGSQLSMRVSILLVDDGSTERPPLVARGDLPGLHRVDVLRLRRNVGHQRAIALALTHVYAHRTCRYVVVMDGDGEDAPEDIVSLMRRCQDGGSQRLVFAKRARRTEGSFFRLGYLSFKAIHRVLTGRPVEVGNFSVFPSSFLEHLVGMPELWNHYAAAVHKVRLPIDMIPIARAYRLRGHSKMNVTALVTHGLSAISVFGEDVGVRLLFFCAAMIATSLLALLLLIGLQLTTDLLVPGWAMNAAGLMALVMMNTVVLTFGFVMFILQSRTNSSFLPLRDYQFYITDSVSLFA